MLSIEQILANKSNNIDETLSAQKERLGTNDRNDNTSINMWIVHICISQQRHITHEGTLIAFILVCAPTSLTTLDIRVNRIIDMKDIIII